MTDPTRSPFWRVLFAGAVLLIFISSLQANGTSVPGRTIGSDYPSLRFLLGGEELESPFTTSAFAAPQRELAAPQPINGVLTLDTEAVMNRIEVLTDSMGIAGEGRWKLETLPPFSFGYVSDGHFLVPLSREPQRSQHPYWEIIPGPGMAWVDEENPAWSRASLPFTLKEKNQNCVHNGLMTFLYKDDGSISRVAWQITNETCQYLKVNLWGMARAEYHPRPDADHSKVIAAHRLERSNRLPVKPIELLAEEYLGVARAGFEPSGIADVSVYGFVIDGIHYRSECQTRFGPYPYCDVLALPSYSVAKSIFAGLAYMLLINRWPEFADLAVSDLVPACKLEDGRWQDVTTRHLVNMNTGLFESTDFEQDEGADKMQAFFLAESDAEKTRFSCEAWPKKSAPGTIAVYHTTDTYLLGVAMNRFLKEKLGQQTDIYRYLHNGFLDQLQLSPLSRWTQRTYDSRQQPFAGYGLIFHVDDIVKIALSINSDSSPDYPVAGEDFDAALLRGSSSRVDFTNQYGDLAYNTGFWGFDFANDINCSDETWIPFMSGYGGIVVAMFPNDSVYYHFSDGGHHSFKNAVVQANNALNFCKES